MIEAASNAAERIEMRTTFIPCPLDAELQLESSVTKTADFAGAKKDLGNGYSPGGIGRLFAELIFVSAIDLADLNETYNFTVMESDDDNTYTPCGPAVAATKTGAFSIPGVVSMRYMKLALDVGGTTPSITYEAWAVPQTGQ